MNRSGSSYYASATETKLDQMNNPTQKAKLIELSNTNKFYQRTFDQFVGKLTSAELSNVNVNSYESIVKPDIVSSIRAEANRDTTKPINRKIIDLTNDQTFKFFKYWIMYMPDPKDISPNDQKIVENFLNNGNFKTFVNYLDNPKNSPKNFQDIKNAMTKATST
jgi:predicted component of type VI protein secretion system